MAETVIITGASQGIGKATTQLFASKGYNVVLAALHADSLQKFAQELENEGTAALAIPTDVRDPEQVNNLVEKAIAHFGSIDIVSNKIHLRKLLKTGKFGNL